MPLQPFNHWKQLYESDHLEKFNFNPAGLLWLKIKSITRKDLLHDFLTSENLSLQATSLTSQFAELYETLGLDLTNAHLRLDAFIRRKHTEQANNLNVADLVSELYKLRYFDWGGDYKNALDKHLIDRYVKIYRNYEDLTGKFETEISRAVQGYVLCSWYNHWSSILIEHIFKSHPAVLPTVGQIKKVDFFVHDIPFDLKVTYLPANFIEAKRKAKGFKPELTELKQRAKVAGIAFGKQQRATDVYHEIVEKMKDRNDELCRQTLHDIKHQRLEILAETQANPRELIQNLYEQQGEMRFDAANRLFLVLVDTTDFDNSWKLKRNLDLLKPAIQHYLDNFTAQDIAKLRLNFNYKGRAQSFTALSDMIFVVK